MNWIVQAVKCCFRRGLVWPLLRLLVVCSVFSKSVWQCVFLTKQKRAYDGVVLASLVTLYLPPDADLLQQSALY